MLEIFRKELRVFFSSLIEYFVIGVFVLLLGLMLWVFPDFSILEYNSASLDQLFFTAPLIFLFLIPAITMRSFSEELQNGTMELLITKPFSYTDIVLGKYFACLVLVIIALFPSLIYYFSIYQLASPIGNVDHGAAIIWSICIDWIVLLIIDKKSNCCISHRCCVMFFVVLFFFLFF